MGAMKAYKNGLDMEADRLLEALEQVKECLMWNHLDSRDALVCYIRDAFEVADKAITAAKFPNKDATTPDNALREAAQTLLDNRVPIPDKNSDYVVRDHVLALKRALNGS